MKWDKIKTVKLQYNRDISEQMRMVWYNNIVGNKKVWRYYLDVINAIRPERFDLIKVNMDSLLRGKGYLFIAMNGLLRVKRIMNEG